MKIEDYSFGKIEINGKKFTEDVIIYPDRLESEWWRKKGHELNPRDISEILEYGPDVLVVGTGSSERMKVPENIEKLLKEHDIELVKEKTSKAIESYNELRGKRKVVAALHLTC
ncbi:MAG: Mth938-like domain-containing protein [Candidatus Aenigmatarchaeota archaeon]